MEESFSKKIDTKKKIMIIISSLKLGGGAEKVATTIGTELHNLGYDVTFLTFYDAINKYDFLGKEICLQEKLSTNFIIQFFKLFKRAYSIKKTCKENKIDTSISFMEESNFPNIFSKIIFRNKSKIIISIRASVDFLGKLYKLFIHLFYKKADFIIPNSEEEKLNLINTYKINPDKIKVIYNPLNLSLIKNLSKEKVEDLFSKNKFTFITIGRLTYQKNQDFLIKVFNKFHEKYKNTQLLIIGSGEDENKLKELAKNNNDIVFLGTQKNVYKYLSKSDCFLFSSRWEGFPNSVMEAMACSLPIISTKFKTGIEELIGDGVGMLVRKDENEFFDAMEEVFVNSGGKQYYKKKSVKKSQNFKLENVIKQRENLMN